MVVEGKDLGFTLWVLQQTDVIQLTDGGEHLGAVVKLTTQVEVA